MEQFACCSLHEECQKEFRCVAERNPFLTPAEVRAYPKLCYLATRLDKLKLEQQLYKSGSDARFVLVP